jgi:hypothetical protein
MKAPQQTDIGRRVIYRPSEATAKYGVITAIKTFPKVFVRFEGQHYSREVNAADLEFFEPSPPLAPGRQRRQLSMSQDGRF